MVNDLARGKADLADFRGVWPLGVGPTSKLGFSDPTRSVLQKPEDNSMLPTLVPM